MNRRPIVIWNLICRYKYLIVTVVGVLIVGFIDDNSFRKRIDYELQISDLKDQIKRYNTQHEEDLKKLHDIQRNPKAIEKIARERYFMKADNEDIYILSDDVTPDDNQDEATE